MSNNLWDDSDESFSDIPDEVSGGTTEVPQISIQRPAVPSRPPIVKQEAVPEKAPSVIEDGSDDLESMFSDAELRLEQGRLYKLILTHDIFDGVDADPRAIDYVQKQIRQFAKESMEVMLGMRQTVKKPQNPYERTEEGPFNSLEMEALRAIAAAATNGATKKDAVLQEKRAGLNTIGGSTKAKPLPSVPSTTIKRNAPTKDRQDDEINRILQEEGIAREEYDAVYGDHDPLKKPLELMSSEELVQRNNRINRKQVKNPSAIPMPPPEQVEGMYAARATQAAAHPQMSMIMNLLEKSKK
jgi:hypothetical protein